MPFRDIWNNLNKTVKNFVEEAEKRRLQEIEDTREEEKVYERYLLRLEQRERKIRSQIAPYKTIEFCLYIFVGFLPIIILLLMPGLFFVSGVFELTYFVIFSLVLYFSSYLLLKRIFNNIESKYRNAIRIDLTDEERRILERREKKRDEEYRRQREKYERDRELETQKLKEELEAKKKSEEWGDFWRDVAGGLTVGLASKALNQDKVYVKGHYRKKKRK